MTQPRMLTGDRPTGTLHLGHYVGTLKNRVRYQHEYRCFFIVADLHMLTTKNRPEDIRAADANARDLVLDSLKNRPEDIRAADANARDLVLDSLAAGIEPEHVTFFLQSAVQEIHEIYTLLQNLVTVARLERIPSLKEMARDAGIEMPYGLLGYPVLQAADILCVRANAVPVGKDNSAHVEVTREIARRFNSLYGELFPIPAYIPGDVPTLVGLDGHQKMSKSLGNAIFLSDTPREVERKVMSMFTDPKRIRADIPGTVEGNPVFIYHDIFNSDRAQVENLKDRYRAGRVGDVEVKRTLAVALNQFLDPMRERRARYDVPGLVEELLWTGTQTVRAEVQQTLYAMRKAMGLTGVWNRLAAKPDTILALKSHYLSALDDEAIETMCRYAATMPVPFSAIHLHQLHGAVSRPPAEGTAFGHRSAAYALNIVGTWVDPEENERDIQWVRAFWSAMERFSSGVYVNFLGEEGEQMVRSAYDADAYARLARVKATYDPNNVFHLNANIKPALASV